MKPRNRSAAFTLLELLVVLAILALVTALAVRSLDRVEEQRRYETAVRGLQEIRDAVLGSPDDRAADGTLVVSGFVADMGRLPRTSMAAFAPELELRELWQNPGVPFDVRPAIVANGVPLIHEDSQVLVSGGWRGPYLRLTAGAETLLDGWGNRIVSPATSSPPDPETTGYARLRDAGDQAITMAGQEVEIIRIPGANGRRDPADTGYDRDEAVVFADSPLVVGDDKFRAAVSGNVEVLDGTSPATPDTSKSITIRVFGPNPADARQIAVASTTVPFAANPVVFNFAQASGVTIGPRVIRAYLHPTGSPQTAATEKYSAVRHATLRAGSNLLNLTIDR